MTFSRQFLAFNATTQEWMITFPIPTCTARLVASRAVAISRREPRKVTISFLKHLLGA